MFSVFAGKKSKSKPTLPWEKRYRAAVGVAEALSYVHSGSSRPVIHRDVKSSNILLTDDFEPQVPHAKCILVGRLNLDLYFVSCKFCSFLKFLVCVFFWTILALPDCI
jgi:serine/threonine protein kinase